MTSASRRTPADIQPLLARPALRMCADGLVSLTFSGSSPPSRTRRFISSRSAELSPSVASIFSNSHHFLYSSFGRTPSTSSASGSSPNPGTILQSHLLWKCLNSPAVLRVW